MSMVRVWMDVISRDTYEYLWRRMTRRRIPYKGWLMEKTHQLL